MFSFYWPWLIILLPLPYLVRQFIPFKSTEGQSREIHFAYIERLRNAFTGHISTTRSNKLHTILISLIWLALVLTIMQPQLVDKFTSVKNKGYDLMLAVDLSGSMRSLDFSTDTQEISRVDMTKQVVSEFIKQRQGDRVGLILFGQNAYMEAPLTLDTSAVVRMLDNAEAGMAGDSTAIGDAIGLAVKSLRDRPKNSRVIILLTDGADNSSSIPPLQAAQLAKEYGIRIYTIAVGSNGPVPYPDGRGNIIMAQFDTDENLLKQIAQKTDGSFFSATDGKGLEEIYKRINSLEKTEAQSKVYLVREPLFRYPLGVAMIMLLIIGLLPLWRRA